MPTIERQAATKLADALRKVGLPEIAGRAEALHYSDFSSPLPGPKLALVDELRDALDYESTDDDEIKSLIGRVAAGEFDG